jgi:hypothetical protein
MSLNSKKRGVTMLENLSNYYMFAPIAQNQAVTILTQDITLGNWRTYYDGILNVMKDGIELPQVHKAFVSLIFPTREGIDISLPDLYVNLVLWYPIIAINKKIGPQHLMIKDTLTADDVKNYMDKHVIVPNRISIPNKVLNNVIADMVCNFADIDNFSLYLANTLNLEDDIDLMNASPEFNQLLHCDLSGVPIESVKDEGMKIVYKAIDIIMDSKKIMGYEHCLRNPFAAHEGINIRQYKENHYNIGTKPDGQGSIYHEIINKSYVTGGLENMVYQLIDSGSSRVAQIISKKNVGESGGFSRILGLNNINSFLNPDPTYDCGTKNFMYIMIPNKEVLNRLLDRYYRFNPKGEEYKIDEKSLFLIGKMIYLRSPMTCASRAQGHGVCYHCYGDLAYTNSYINIGRIATEIITSQYTQKRLSAKHLLETLISIINWNEGFKKFFGVETNSIKLQEALDIAMQGFKIIIDPDSIQLENDDEFLQHKFFSDDMHSTEDDAPFYNEYVTEFKIETPTGEEIDIGSIPDDESPEAKMYFSTDLSNAIRTILQKNKKEEIDEEHIVIPLKMMEDKTLFYIKIQNNDLGKNLDIFNDLINKKPVTKSYTKDKLLEKLLETVIKGGIDCASVHLEVILSNQIKDPTDRLKEVNWLVPDAKYEILTLNEALTDNQSIINSLVYQKLAKTLYTPMTFKKKGASIFDPFFMHKPKKFLNANHEVWDEQNQPKIRPGECPVMFVKDHSGERPKNIQEILKKYNPQEPTELDD